MFEAQKEWICPENYPDLKGYKYIAIDLETKDPELKSRGSGAVSGKGNIVGIALAVEGWSAYYPIAHEGGGNLNNDQVVDFIDKLLKLKKKLVFANALYDMEWLNSHDSRLAFTKHHSIYDIQAIEHLLDENKLKYSLESLSQYYLKKSKYEAELEQAIQFNFGKKAKVKENLWKLHANSVREYAKEDALLTL